jgi:hypothetical protein
MLLDGCACPYEVGPLEAAVRQSSVFVSPCHDNTILRRASCSSCVLFVVHLHVSDSMLRKYPQYRIGKVENEVGVGLPFVKNQKKIL